MRASWVKGHVTQTMVDSGKYRQQDMLGNDEADHLADRGVGTHGSSLVLQAKF